MAAKKPSNELKITRIYDAPVKTVWKAFTEPDQVAKWWGPRGFTLTTHSKDLKNGGHWHYTMHGPDGTDWPNKTYYHEVEIYKRLVYDHGANDNQPPLFRVDVTFKDIKGKTQMDMRMILASPEIAQETAKFIKKAGGNSTWDRLAEYLETSESGKENFVINRSFDAPIDVVFDMWIKPEHFAKWLPPIGVNMTFIRADIRPGGISFWSMSDDSGSLKMFGRLHHVEITRPNRIIYLQQFTDENENIARHPMAPTWPETMHTTVDLTEEEDGQTRVTVTWRPEGHVTAEELSAFVQEKAGMTQGWSGSFDKLEELLSAK